MKDCKIEMPTYQGVIGNTHVVAVDWAIEGLLPDGRRYRVTVRKGFKFDGASIPRFLWRVCGHPLEVPRIAAALAHDWLYAAHVTDRKTADAIYKAICLAVGVGRVRSYIEHATLRLCGGAAWWSHGPDDVTFARSHGAIELTHERENMKGEIRR